MIWLHITNSNRISSIKKLFWMIQIILVMCLSQLLKHQILTKLKFLEYLLIGLLFIPYPLNEIIISNNGRNYGRKGGDQSTIGCQWPINPLNQIRNIY